MRRSRVELRKGFSLIEVLVVVAIMSVSGLALMTMQLNQLKTNNFTQFQLKRTDLQNLLSNQVLSSSANCKCLFERGGVTEFAEDASFAVPESLTPTTQPTALGPFDSATTSDCSTATLAAEFITADGKEAVKLAQTQMVGIIKLGPNQYTGQFEVQIEAMNEVLGPSRIPLRIPVQISTVAGSTTGKVKLNGCSATAPAAVASVPEVIRPGTGSDGQTGTQACAAKGRTCGYVQSLQTVFGDPGCGSGLHCMRVCQTWYNQSLPGIPNKSGGDWDVAGGSGLTNMFGCDARVGIYTTYLDSGVVRCGGYFSAVCF